MSHSGDSPSPPSEEDLLAATDTLIQYARWTNGQGDWHSDTEVMLWVARSLLAPAGTCPEWFNLSLGMIDDIVEWNNQAVIRLAERTDEPDGRKITLARDLLSSLDDSDTKYTVTYTPENGAHLKVEPAAEAEQEQEQKQDQEQESDD